MRLEGKVALISGGARGQGAVEAKLFASEGASVVIGDILDDLGRQVEAEIAESGGNATYVHLDVTSESQWNDAVNTAIERYGKLDILVNNAGILIRAGVEDTTEEDWDRIMGHQRKGRVPGHEGRDPGDARGGRRLYHQHLVGGWTTGKPGVPPRTARPRARYVS